MNRSFFRCIYLFCLILFSAHCTQADETTPALPALAVLVHTEPGGEALAEPLRALLEVETSQRYEGALLERAEIATVLQELKLSSLLGGGAETGAVQAGKMDKAACLVLARVSEKKVHLTVTSFPKTEVILDKEYSERLEAASLAERISGDALSAVRARARDTKTPYVSIGSFYCVDPHRRLLEFSRTTEAEMRKQLSATPDVRLMERMFPSDLLNEFNLARGGMTVSQATDFSAPPADLLIYGECTPQKDQDLNNPGIVLDCVVTVTSPTSLIPTRSITATCRSDDIAPLIEKSKALLIESVVTARENLAKGSERAFSTQEFEAFKKQAFRLMPTPPNQDGVFYRRGSYHGWGQEGKREELERALRMLECAQLFTGTDTTVLVSTAAVLSELSKRHAETETVSHALLRATTELINRAYRTESNWNTRGFYGSFMLDDRLSKLSDSNGNLILAAAHQIWSTRDAEPWWDSMIDHALSTIMASESDWAKRAEHLLDAAPMYEKRREGLRHLLRVVQPMLSYSSTTEEVEKIFGAHALFSKRLIAGDAPFLQAVGHLVAVDRAAKQYSVQPDPQYAREFLDHYRTAKELSPKLETLYPKEFAFSKLDARLDEYFVRQEKMLAEAGLHDDGLDRKAQSLLAHLTTLGTSISGTDRTLREIIPGLRESRQDERTIALLRAFLNRYNVGGSGDGARMEFTRILHEYTLPRENPKRLRLNQLTAVSFDDGQTGPVYQLVASRQGIFGVRKSIGYAASGKAFRLAPDGNIANLIAEPIGVYDIACTDKYVAVSTWKNGLYLLDTATAEIRQLTPANSALPSTYISLMAGDGADFIIGIPEKSQLFTLFYRLEPEAGRLTKTESTHGIHSFLRITAQPGNEPVVPQTWQQQTTKMDGKQLTFTVAYTNDPTKDVTVTNESGETIFRYRGYDLNYVYNFTTWQNHLVFVTGNGLYVSKPGTNELRCILSEPDLILLSSCIVDEQMYLGTNKGTYILDATQFLAASID